MPYEQRTSDKYGLATSGDTSHRPTQTAYVGKRYLDTEQGKPVWWNGTDWVDATGTAA